jgi:hypothetical protein
LDYFKQRRAYRQKKLIELHISAGQNNLYRELLDYANDEGLLEQWFEVKNEALTGLTGLSDRGMKEARNALVQSGLVQYRPGKRSASNPQYKITDLCLSRYQNSASVSTNKVPQGVPQVVPQGVPPNYLTKTDQDKTKTSQQSRKREYADDSPEMIEAKYLWGWIQKNNPEANKDPNFQHWADDIRKMHELDGRPFDKIHRMIDWSQKSDFWAPNILSAAKLRAQYLTMAAKANAEANKKRGKSPFKASEQPAWADPNYQAPAAKEADAATKQRLAQQMAQFKADQEALKEQKT